MITGKILTIGVNFTKNSLTTLLLLSLLLLGLTLNFKVLSLDLKAQIQPPKRSHWFLLERKSNLEYLYFGIPGVKAESSLIRIFKVKTGIPNERPTPLPQLLGREYWLVEEKLDTSGNPETAPFFITLDVPISQHEPYGPYPYLECNGQCNWEVPGAFGLHGTGSTPQKLSSEDPGSSGCIRHSNEDIHYLYNLLDPKKEEIRYYILDV